MTTTTKPTPSKPQAVPEAHAESLLNLNVVAQSEGALGVSASNHRPKAALVEESWRD